MAVSNLLPRKAKGDRTRSQTLQARFEYDEAEEKTGGGKFITSYMCSPETAAEEFEMSKLIYQSITGRSQSKEKDIIAYRIIQSFKPSEIMPEEANRIGYELAMRFTKGRHQFFVATHTDKAHIHNHIEFNSTNLECDGKFNNFKNSSFALRRLNDEICREHGCSVIEKPGARRQQFAEKGAAKRGASFKEHLRVDIDNALSGCRDFEEFLARMRAEGYEVRRRGKSLEFKAQGQERYRRSYRLGEDYSEEALQGRIAGTWKAQRDDRPKKSTGNCEKAAKKKQTDHGRRVNLLVDIQAKIQAGKGKGYERWAKVFNLKEAAKTLNFLTENGVEDYGELVARAEAAGKKFDELSARIKRLEGRMAEIARLKNHIINYSKTREVYKEYKRSRNQKAYRAEHAEEIEKHEAAKAAFDALGGKTIPKVAQLNKEYAKLLAEKKVCYEEYKKVRQDMIDYQTARANVDKILGAPAPGQEEKREQRMEH